MIVRPHSAKLATTVDPLGGEQRRVPRLAVEAASPFGWSVLTPDVVAMTTYGRSGKGPDLYRLFGITPQAVAAKAQRNPEPMRIATAAHPQED